MWAFALRRATAGVVVPCANASVLAHLLLLSSVPADLGQAQCGGAAAEKEASPPPEQGQCLHAGERRGRKEVQALLCIAFYAEVRDLVSVLTITAVFCCLVR